MLLRDVQVKFRLTQAEEFQLVRTAQDAGLSTAAFIRKCCLNSKHFTIINRKQVSELYSEVNKIGSNINQVAKIANSTRQVSEKKLDNLIKMQQEICRLIDKKLGGV